MRALAIAFVLFVLAAPSFVHAQVELTGTYVTYFAVGPDGRFMNGTHTFQYTESGSMPYSCDFFFPGSPYEGFYLHAVASGVGSERSNTEVGPAQIATTDPTSLSGRMISWRGQYTHASVAGAQIDIDQAVSYGATDRAVRVDVTLRNSGTVALTEVVYGRRGEPDQGSCSIGSDYTTTNDVVRQPPASESALLTAAGGMTSTVILGVGSFDSRARMDVGGFPSGGIGGVWMSPRDPDGVPEDTWVNWAFREASLAVGASTTFTFFYVFGTTPEQIVMRFDELGFPSAPCMGLAEGAACTTPGGATGLCRRGVCCTGCFDGTRCVSGSSTSACGARGSACANCNDGMFCTADACTAGACSSAPSPTICDDGMSCTMDTCREATDDCAFTFVGGCIIGGICVGDGETNPSYPCQHCDSARNPMDWSFDPVGTACGSPTCAAGRLRTSVCNTTGSCVLGAAMTCPTGACASSTECAAPCTPTSCAAGEICNPVTMRCEPLRTAGMPCTDGAQCLSGSCADDVCCDSACDGLCERCNVPTAPGTCTALGAGTDPDDECPVSECDGARGCLSVPDAGPPPGEDAGPEADAGTVLVDAGPRPDAGGTTPRRSERGGCSCHSTGSRGAGTSWLFAAFVAAGLVRTARRRRGQYRPPDGSLPQGQ